MNSREFFTQALLQAHNRTVEHFLMNNEGDQLDIETADKLAETAFALRFFGSQRYGRTNGLRKLTRCNLLCDDTSIQTLPSYL
jgi:hypothetical protein